MNEEELGRYKSRVDEDQKRKVENLPYQNEC